MGLAVVAPADRVGATVSAGATLGKCIAESGGLFGPRSTTTPLTVDGHPVAVPPAGKLSARGCEPIRKGDTMKETISTDADLAEDERVCGLAWTPDSDTVLHVRARYRALVAEVRRLRADLAAVTAARDAARPAHATVSEGEFRAVAEVIALRAEVARLRAVEAAARRVVRGTEDEGYLTIVLETWPEDLAALHESLDALDAPPPADAVPVLPASEKDERIVRGAVLVPRVTTLGDCPSPLSPRAETMRLRVTETVLRERVTALVEWARETADRLDHAMFLAGETMEPHRYPNNAAWGELADALEPPAIAAEVAARIARGESA